MAEHGSSSGVPAPESSEELVRLAAATQVREPPRPSAAQDCGDLAIHIDREGAWHYRGTPIRRPALVRLFSTVLRREGDDYLLVTPAERGRISVADAPFLAVELDREGEGSAQRIVFRTNVEERVILDRTHPLRIATSAAGEPRPYVVVRDGLEARLLRPVFYALVELSCEERVGGATLIGVWSKGHFFPLGPAGPR